MQPKKFGDWTTSAAVLIVERFGQALPRLSGLLHQTATQFEINAGVLNISSNDFEILRMNRRSTRPLSIAS